MREEVEFLLSLGGLNLSSYGLMMGLAALLGTVLTLIVARKRIGLQKSVSVCVCAILGALIGGHLVYCLTSLGSILADYESGISLLWQFQLGGYTLYGALLGGIAALAVYALCTHTSLLPLLDVCAPGAMLTLAVGRAAEVFSNQGLGGWLDEDAEGLLCFPFGVAIVYEDDYTEWRVPIFVYEAAVALILMIVVLVLLHRSRVPGRTAASALVLLSATQIFLEQLREDDYIRFGFVRFTQLAAIACITFILGIRLYRSAKAGGWKPALTLRASLLVVSALITIFVEFALEKPQFLPYLRIALLAEAALMSCWLMDLAAGMYHADGHRRHITSHAALSVIIVAVAVMAVYLLTLSLEWENTLLLILMALAMAVSALVTEHRTDEDRGAG